jgi:hypothetical protein
MVQTGSHSEMGSEKFGNSAKSGYKGTIRSDIRYLVLSKDVRRHRLISIDYITTLRCHGRGCEFESRRPRSFNKYAAILTCPLSGNLPHKPICQLRRSHRVSVSYPITLDSLCASNGVFGGAWNLETKPVTAKQNRAGHAMPSQTSRTFS